MPKDTESPAPKRVGVVGAGQLARMLSEAASALGIELVVLSPSAVSSLGAGARLIVGTPFDAHALDELARAVDVITLDHELVDLVLLDDLASRGVPVYPSPLATTFAAHKDHQRRVLAAHDVPVPHHVILDQWSDEIFDDFTRFLVAPPVVKAGRGGYDGRGVVMADTLDEARSVARVMLESGPVLLEERLDLLGELAVLFVTRASGERRHWPVVRTVQHDGLCTEVRYPSQYGDDVEQQALEVAERVAELVGAVGVLAVELFLTASGIVVNEVATRPHNSGHWTIEGSTTSQFENHLRAVLDLPLGSTEPRSAATVMVNVVGSHAPGDLSAALAVDGAHVHEYAKQWRPGRKLGHVTVCGDEPESVRVRAWRSAEALGTSARKETT